MGPNNHLIGRSVHWREGGKCYAAIVTEADDMVGLDGTKVRMLVLPPRGGTYAETGSHNPTPTNGTWHWPEKETDNV